MAAGSSVLQYTALYCGWKSCRRQGCIAIQPGVLWQETGLHVSQGRQLCRDTALGSRLGAGLGSQALAWLAGMGAQVAGARGAGVRGAHRGQRRAGGRGAQSLGAWRGARGRGVTGAWQRRCRGGTGARGAGVGRCLGVLLGQQAVHSVHSACFDPV